MDETQSFGQDCVAILGERHARGEITRRGVLAALAAMGLAPAAAQAALPQVVLANWGGDAERVMGQTFLPNYEKATGGRMVIDGSGPSNGKIRAMVEAKNVTWDVCDAGSAAIGELGPLGMLTPIDYAVVDKTKTIPAFVYEYGVCNYLFSFVTIWDTARVKEPPSAADFFDLKKYPGRRMIRKDAQPMMELALMADGVPRDQLYPMDVKRALAKIASIKDSLLFWSTGTQSQDLMRSNEAVMGWMWHTRANLLKTETKGRLDWRFDGGVLVAGLWVVPRGNPAGAQVMQAIRTFQDPEPQVVMLKELGNGPSNPAADAMVPAEFRAINPGSAENQAKQAKMNYAWWMQNYKATFAAYQEMIAS